MWRAKVKNKETYTRQQVYLLHEHQTGKVSMQIRKVIYSSNMKISANNSQITNNFLKPYSIKLKWMISIYMKCPE